MQSRPSTKAAPKTRQEHAEETAQDYVELIASLIATKGEARVIDIARHFHITHVTVTKTIQRLQKVGYVRMQPYRSIFLTEAGQKLAKESQHRHDIVYTFLRSLGIPSDIAASDAEGIEHHVSKETLSAFMKYLKKSK